ncbi:MAG: phospho-N-acetylmuramoyl-pentapeptide-transferase, partial [Erysipelotrichaceae bacterium]|nr:phospho-N-acetylmuramoyl-pentapeptide-transferase [Erysipelotrichaceae bacterium]
SLLGYLKFNLHPAKIFMGDTGSLAIGGLLAASAMILKKEVLLVFIGGIFVIELLSVVIQVISFKTRGKRVFKMAPIHHHFELSGLKETQVVLLFWSIGLIFAIVGLWLGVL